MCDAEMFGNHRFVEGEITLILISQRRAFGSHKEEAGGGAELSAPLPFPWETTLIMQSESDS